MEEDTLLRQRMAELADQQTNTSSSSNGSSGVGGNGSNGVGIWKQLETDFRRSASSIQKRWYYILISIYNTVYYILY